MTVLGITGYVLVPKYQSLHIRNTVDEVGICSWFDI